MVLNLGGEFFDSKALRHRKTPTIGSYFLRYGNHLITLQYISFLLDRGEDPNVRFEEGTSFLHLAVRNCHDNAYVDLMLRLISCGADVQAVDERGCSITQMACTYSHLDEMYKDSTGF